MIISASTGNGFGGAISYIHKQHETQLTEERKPKILEENMVFGSISDQAYMMRDIAKRNARSSRPVLHLSVSFHQEEKLSESVRNQIFDKILQELCVTRDNNQFIIAQHFDADHEHYHILLNKVGFDRTNVNTSYIKNKCQVIADKIEIDLGLRKTTGRTVVYDADSKIGFRYTTKEERHPKKIFLDKSINVRTVKTELREIIFELIKLTKTVQELLYVLKGKGVDCKADFDASQMLKGISFRYKEQAYKGSQLGLKSKAIQQHYDNLNFAKDIKIKTEYPEKITGQNMQPSEAIKTASSDISPADVSQNVPGKEENGEVKHFVETEPDLDKIAAEKFEKQRKDLYQQISDLETFKNQYSRTSDKILTKIKKGEKSHEEFLNLFLQHGFKISDNKMIFKSYSFNVDIPIKWINKSIENFTSQENSYQKASEDYTNLMNEPFVKIKILTLPDARKRIKMQNEELKIKKNTAEKPKLEIWGLLTEETIISGISQKVIAINSNISKLESQERNRRIEEQARKPLSKTEIDFHLNIRNNYPLSEDYEYGFLEKYEHKTEFKDLFWLDKFVSNLENDEEKAEFLKGQFLFKNLNLKTFVPKFLDNDPYVIKVKIMLINSLATRIISKEEKSLMTKNGVGGFTGTKGLFLKNFNNSIEAFVEQKLETVPEHHAFFKDRVEETLKYLDISNRNYEKYFITDELFITQCKQICSRALQQIAADLKMKETPKKSRRIRF